MEENRVFNQVLHIIIKGREFQNVKSGGTHNYPCPFRVGHVTYSRILTTVSEG